jgi:hypothetical protein
MMRTFRILSLIIILIACVSDRETQAQEKLSTNKFQYLQFEESSLNSVHAIRLALDIPDGFKRTGFLNHNPVFHEHPFNVSAAAVYDSMTIIMVHAEALGDSSGYLNYSYMETATLNDIAFYTKDNCVEITEALLSDARDLQFFQNEGFDFYPAIYLKQYFKTADDGNAEFVLSYGERVCDCSETTINEAFKEQFMRRLTNTVNLTEQNK